MKIFCRWGFAFATLLMGVVGSGFAAEPPRVVDSEFAEFHQRWLDTQQALAVPSFALVVVRGDDVVLLDAFGDRALPGSPPTNPDTMFYIASCTKPYNALAAMALVEDGKLELDKPVLDYLPKFALADSQLAAELTVRDLLCHRYGLDSSLIVFNDAYSGQINDQRYFRLLSHVTPGGQVQYSNVHFTLLGRVIQSVSGEAWRDYLRDRVLLPAGMTRTTGYASIMYDDENSAKPMVQMNGEWNLSPVRKTDRTMHAAGGMGTTARDLGRWLRLNLNGGQLDGRQIVSTESVEQMQTLNAKLPRPSGKIRQRVGFGLGWFIGNYRSQDHTYIDHGGGYVGTAAHVSFIPEKSLGVGILANSSPGGQALCDIISIDIYDDELGVEDADLLPIYKKRIKEFASNNNDLPSGANPAEGDGLSLPPEKYVGSYAHTDWGTVVFQLAGGQLSADCGDLHLALHSTARDEFAGLVVPGMVSHGKFKIESDTVTEVEMETIDGERARFVRTAK